MPVLIQIETDLSSGMPAFTMVGMLGNEVRESRDRVVAALKNTGIALPASRITINLSPADLHKEGTAFDLPIAISILCAMEIIPQNSIEHFIFLGELGLNGEIKPVRGVLPIVRQASLCNYQSCILPFANLEEGSIIPNIQIFGAKTLRDVITFFVDSNSSVLYSKKSADYQLQSLETPDLEDDFEQVAGQDSAKRAAVIAATGFHSLLMTGPPGAGKSMIAKRIPGILPPLTLEESLEVSSIHSIAGILPTNVPLIRRRIFQNPHHSISLPALIGGGLHPKPGAISLAHRSVLFLDELTEFSRVTLDSLRQPLEEHKVHIARLSESATFPADFLLVCAMNPCPCGYYPDRNKCTCTDPMIRNYLGKISGPILDRIDLCIELQAVSISDIQLPRQSITSAQMRSQVLIGRQMQEERFQNTPFRFNAELTERALSEFCPLGKSEQQYMEEIGRKLELSARAYHRSIKVARTIADLQESPQIKKEHLLEAVCYRPDQKYWI